MSSTDTTERGFEDLIIAAMTSSRGRGDYLPAYVEGAPQDFNRDYAVDLIKLNHFIKATQPEVADALGLNVIPGQEKQAETRQRQFLYRLQGEIAKRGVVDVLRHGIKHKSVDLTLFYGTPTPGNIRAAELFNKNIFSITRQLRYSKDETRLSLDLCLFINGLPIATFELKNRLTKQTVNDAIQQYKRDRDPRELLFQFGRCLVHFAVDDQEVWMCTHLKGRNSWFLPFNKGFNDGAGNPPKPDGLKTAYLWEETLAPVSLTNIIENYAQIIETTDDKNRKRRFQIFPRYHQLDAVRKLLTATAHHGVGGRYLVQHSAGSGKSNSIAWLAHQLVDLRGDHKTTDTPGDDTSAEIFDSVIIVTDRLILDKQLKDTIRQFAQVSATIGHADKSGDLRRFLEEGKKIIISTVQKFPFVLDEIGNSHRQRKFAIIIDEAHSSQGGRVSAKMSMVLAEQGAEEEESYEDIINRIMESRKMLSNASYFAFTATPKGKTLELFGIRSTEGEQTPFRPFHSYTMKQAIQEGFILDVLANYTPVPSYYRLIKSCEDDPQFDSKKAMRKLRHYVESHSHAIQEKAEIMVDHFHEHVSRQKINGKARAMVICTSIKRAIDYYKTITAYLQKRKSPYKAIVAFSDFKDKAGKVTEAQFNGFSGKQIPARFKEEPYRFLIVADKYQTGYDEPLLHTMYVDKHLSGIRAVQSLSRLNRAHPHKHDTFVLDFMNDVDTIQKSFADFYRTTVLSDETDRNRLHDMKATLDRHQIYTADQVSRLAELFLCGEPRDRLDPLLDHSVGLYMGELDEDAQIEFKGTAKAFIRSYQFLASITSYNNREWEELSIFLNFLVPKLPSPAEDDLSKGILQTVDMDSYRNEVQESRKIYLEDEEGVIDTFSETGGGVKPEPEMDYLSAILQSFNERFGNIEWEDEDRIRKIISEEIPAAVSADKAYKNAMKNSDRAAAKLEHNRALKAAIVAMLSDHAELYKHFYENPGFNKELTEMIFSATYKPGS
ncbi:MAG: type I restriction endonuclease subunit R [Lentisphaerae bacterium]|nr:type I restriction endonuclease subunit R [Lentisphaerota bacterium]